VSVLIEALTLVVPKVVLDVSYPGGSDAFLDALLHVAQPPRYICNGDEHLINASFYDPEHIRPAERMLQAQGVIGVDGGKFIEFACLDQRFGPTMPCDWLDFRRHRQGFSYAWLRGSSPGDMAAPDGWTAEQSKRLVRRDIRDEAGRCLLLASENGLETWIDFATGEVSESLPQREAGEESGKE
jgi:hypothetical protein